MKFSELNLESSLASAIEKLNYSDCTPIQEQAVGPILEGRDVAGLAQTGTGKTAAFLIPLMERILRARPAAETASDEEKALIEKRSFKDWKPQNFILVLVPTRELAEQVYENVQKLSEFSGLKGYPIYGGTGYDKQKEAIKNGLDFLIATPGRMIDLYKEHLIDLKQVRAIVFDEADRMFDMGFKDDMKYILQRVPQDRQFLVFSATLNFDVLNTAYQFGSEPFEINISRDQAKADNVKDAIFHVGNEEKPQHLLSIIKLHQAKQVIVFTNFKHNVERVAKFLTDNGLPAMAISSLLTQAQRNRVIEQFKAENEMNILVATDVAARGLDIKGVDLVINYELPNDAESYVHRIGRTGRAGTEGKAFSLVSDKDIDSLARVEEYLKNKLETQYLENDQLIKEFKPFPHESSSRQGGGRFDRERRPSVGGGERRQGRSGPGGREGQGPRSSGRHGGKDDRKSDRRSPHKSAGGEGQAHKPRHERPAGAQAAARGPASGKPMADKSTHKKQVPKYNLVKKPMIKAKPKSFGEKVSSFFKRLFS
ncbi:MAG: DEAD/DEAH box helicase [Bdellovibrionia bacterium]